MNKIYYAGLVTAAVLLIGFASPQIFGFLSNPTTPVSTETPIPTQTDTAIPIPTQSPTPSPTPTSPVPTSTPTPNDSPSPTPAETPYPNPSSGPTPTPNQSPTPTPLPTTSGIIQLGYYIDTKRYSWEMSQFQSENYGWLHAQAEYLAPYADKSVHYDYQGFMTETEASTELAVLIESQIASQIVPTPAPTPTLSPSPSPTPTPTTTPSPTVNIEAYWDSTCTSPISSIDWGLLEAGGSTNRMIYLKNEAAEDLTLSMSLSDWTPSNAEDYITISWDCEGEVISPDQILGATLTCSVSVDIDGISTFNVTIVISGTELT